MITLTSETGKTIRFSMSDTNKIVNECGQDMYNVALPSIICSDIQDAKIMQERINMFVNKLGHELMK